MRSFSMPKALWLILLTSSTIFLISFAPRFLCVKVPSTKQPFSCLLLSAMLFSALSKATFSCGEAVLTMVDHRASIGRSNVPSANVASSKNALRIFSSSGSNPCSMSVFLRFATPSSYFSPIKRRNTSVSIISLFSKNEPEFFAFRNISLHLNKMLSRLRVSSFFAAFRAMAIVS